MKIAILECGSIHIRIRVCTKIHYSLMLDSRLRRDVTCASEAIEKSIFNWRRGMVYNVGLDNGCWLCSSCAWLGWLGVVCCAPLLGMCDLGIGANLAGVCLCWLG